MTLDAFIGEHMEAILTEWEKFVSALPPSAGLDRPSIRNDAEKILESIVFDMCQPQSSQEQPLRDLPEYQAAKSHAGMRLAEGFDLNQVVSEYCALRAIAARLWLRGLEGADIDLLSQLARFNTALDRSLACSIARYTEELDQSREIFLGILGHDLRTPIGAILMSAEYMLLDESLSPSHVATASCVLRSAKRIKKIVSDILDFARTRLGGALPLECRPTNLCPICEQVVQEARVFHQNRVVLLSMDNNLDGIWDEARLGQMLSNVIANAIEHGDSETPVNVCVQGKEEKVLISIHNEGEVIPPSELGRIFEPLKRRGSPHRHSDGLGLGLFIARTIAQAHKGVIEVESSREQGTTFRIYLPRDVIYH